MMSNNSRKGFTIVELMMVIAIIGILLGVVTTAASSSIKQARARKADACCTIVEQAFATYYAQKGHWPAYSKSGITGVDSESDYYTIPNAKVADMIRELIKEARAGNPLMDISGLFVSRNGNMPTYDKCRHGNNYHPVKGALGLDFIDAVRGTKQSKKKMSLSEMYFGYPHPNGGFMPFRVVYSIPADSIRVERWHTCD